MSSDSEKLPKPSKRPRPILSDSETSDGSFINTIRGRRRAARVISEGESSEDDSDVPMRAVRRSKNHKLASDEGSTSDSSELAEDETRNFEGGSTSSEWQSDWESMEESESETINKNCKSKKSTCQLDISSGSDTGDENAVKCPICLLSFRKQEIGNPAVCEHCFCLECLIEWSKNVNTCPIDRLAFEVINVRSKLGGKITRYMPIEVKNPAEEVVQEDPTYCEVCHRCDREDRMLLCDGCDCGYHLECLNPPLEQVPEDHWFCRECALNTQDEAEEIPIDLDEVPDLMEEARSLGLLYGRSRANVLPAAAERLRRRLLPRTRQTERVRENVRTRRAVAASLLSHQQPSTSSGFDSISENSVPGPSRVRAVKSRRTTTKRKIKRKTKRRTTTTTSRRSDEMREVRIQEINADGQIEEIVTYVRAGNNEAATTRRRRKKRKRRKKQSRCRTVASRAAAMKTAKRRLASQLGIARVGTGPQLTPTLKNEPERSNPQAALRIARNYAGLAPLSLFGSGLGLDYSPPGSDNEYEDQSTDGVGLLSRVVRRPMGIRRRAAIKAGLISNSTATTTDLLSDILSSQEIWHSRKAKIELKNDGSIKVSKPELNNNNNNTSPIKKDDKPLNLNNVDANNLIQQAPMYNNPRGGNRGGNYRGGGNYRENTRHSHGGNNYNSSAGGNYNSGGGRDSYSRHSFGGTSNLPQDYSQTGPHFQHTPPPLMQQQQPPFRNRNNQNRFPDQNRNQRQQGFARPPPPPPLAHRMSGPSMQQPLDMHRSTQKLNETNDGMYDDLPERSNNGDDLGLCPPPEPPEGLMDFDESERGNDSDREEDLVIDDAPKEQTTGNQVSADKYDPFADMDSDSDDEASASKQTNKASSSVPPLMPPPGLSSFPDLKGDDNESMLGDGASMIGDGGSIAGDNASVIDDEDMRNSQPLRPPPAMFDFAAGKRSKKKEDPPRRKQEAPRVRLTAYEVDEDEDDDEDSDDNCPNFSIYSSETMVVARHTEQQMASQVAPLEPPPMPFGMEEDELRSKAGTPPPLEPPPMFEMEDEMQSKAGSPPPPLEPPPMPFEMDELQSKAGSPPPLEPPPMPFGMEEDELRSKAGSPPPLEPPPMPFVMDEDMASKAGSPPPLEPPPMPFGMDEDELRSKAGTPPPLEPPPMPFGMEEDELRSKAGSPAPLEPPPMFEMEDEMASKAGSPPPLEPPPMPPIDDDLADKDLMNESSANIKVIPQIMPLAPPPTPPVAPLEPPPTPPPTQIFATPLVPPPVIQPMLPPPLMPPPIPPIDELSIAAADKDSPLEPPPAPPSILGDDEDMSGRSSASESDESSEEVEQEVNEEGAPVIGPKNRQRKKKDDAAALKSKESKEGEEGEEAEEEEHKEAYLDAVQRERQNLNKGKIQLDTRGKITFKIGNVSRLNKVNLYDDVDESEVSHMKLDIAEMEKERELERELEKDKTKEKDKPKSKDRDRGKVREKEKDKEKEKPRDRDKSRDRDRDKDKDKERDKRKDADKSDKYESKSRHDKESRSRRDRDYDEKKTRSRSKYDDSKRQDTKSSKTSGWDIKPSYVSSSSSSSSGSASRSGSSSESEEETSARKSSSAKKSTSDGKAVRIDLSELEKTVGKKLVEVDDGKKQQDVEIVTIADDADYSKVQDDDLEIVDVYVQKDRDKEREKEKEREMEMEKEIERERELVATRILPEVDSLFEEIEKTCEVQLSKIPSSFEEPPTPITEREAEDKILESDKDDDAMSISDGEKQDEVDEEEDAEMMIKSMEKSMEDMDMMMEMNLPGRDAVQELAEELDTREDDEEEMAKKKESDEEREELEDEHELIEKELEQKVDDEKKERQREREIEMTRQLEADSAAALESIVIDDDEEEPRPRRQTSPMRIRRLATEERARDWEAEGMYTPCKDELVSDKRAALLASDLEPITPIAKRMADGLDGIRTPAGYAGLGTEAISETDETMNFEDELALLSIRGGLSRVDVEEGEIPEVGPRRRALLLAAAAKARAEEEGKRKKKKEKKKDSKDSEKENIDSENNLATSSWKKATKAATKERQYREKRSKSKDAKAKKKKDKDAAKKKEKRKELPRYDVRKLVAEKPRVRKDEYGRDIRPRSSSRSRSLSLSRDRSLSQERRTRSVTPRRRVASRSRSRSFSRERVRRSRSREYRSVSRRRSLSPRGRRVEKVVRRRSLSRDRARSRTPRRRSLSPRKKVRGRSVTRKHRSRSRSRSSSRSHSRRKENKKKHGDRSRSRVRKRSVSKNRKRSKSRKKHAKHRSRSREYEAAEQFVREAAYLSANQGHWTPSWSRSRSKSPQPLLSNDHLGRLRNWSPPPLSNVVAPKNLKVILTNKEAIKKKKKEKRKEGKKKEMEKKRKNKKGRSPPPSKEVFASGDNILVSVCFNKDSEVQQVSSELPETIPLLPQLKRRRREPLQLEAAAVQPPTKKSKKDKSKEKAAAAAAIARAKSPTIAKVSKKKEKKKSKAAEIAASKKPMAVIDLDQSPFREQTPSPRDVIVLDSDEDELEKQARAAAAMEMGTPEQPQESHTPARPDASFQQGPKTPPEPQVKFSIANKQSNLRTTLVNPLMEDEEDLEPDANMSMTAEMAELMDEQAEEELELRAQEELENRMKVGPNTPPEPPTSPPTSPDAYDPFDPTKSRSPTPEPQEGANAEQQAGSSPLEPSTDQGTFEATSQDDQKAQPQETVKIASDKPKIISMVTIKKPSPVTNTPPLGDSNDHDKKDNEIIIAAQTTITQTTTQTVPTSQLNALTQNISNPVLATIAASVQKNMFNAATQLAAPRNLLTTNTLLQNSQKLPLPRPSLPMPSIFLNSVPKPPARTLPMKLQSKNMSMLGQNGSDANIEISTDNIVDMSSPYSPGSSLSDGLFDPPSPAFNSSPNHALSSKNQKNRPKRDDFDSLFDASPIVHRSSNRTKIKRQQDKDKKKKGTHSKIGVRMDENQLQILDDLPSSAVEMQVKDKFLKKLNRQERVVEEVKLVLKPHYTKKHVTKEEYKDIMRKAVPKICHNKSGEINPKKIGALIEAYVKKVRSKKKQVSGSAAILNNVKSAKKMWG